MSISAENEGKNPCGLPLPNEHWSVSQELHGVPGIVTAANISNENQCYNSERFQQRTTEAGSLLHYPQQSKQLNTSSVLNPINPSSSGRKMRKKTEIKPQSQINKCNNEKRRRELENNYIEQLGEMLQLSKRGDMTSAKPDKAAILNQVVKFYTDIVHKGKVQGCVKKNITSSICSKCSLENCLEHPVQQGDVTSTDLQHVEISESVKNSNSTPATIAPEISANFEALEHYISSQGWVLLQINHDGKILSCTQNIRDFIGFEKSDLLENNLQTYLHTNDIHKLKAILDNRTSNNNPSLEKEDLQYKNKKSASTRIHMLTKQSSRQQDDDNNNKYKDLLLFSTPAKVSVEEPDDPFALFICLITKPDIDEIKNFPQWLSENATTSKVCHPTLPICTTLQTNQFTLKLDTHGEIIENTFSNYCVGKNIRDICHESDKEFLNLHFETVMRDSRMVSNQSNKNISEITNNAVTAKHIPSNYSRLENCKLKLNSSDIYLTVQIDSRLFVNSTPGEFDYIMSILTVYGQQQNITNSLLGNSNTTSSSNDLFLSNGIESTLNNQKKINPLVNSLQDIPSNVGGPLMTSVLSGLRNSPQRLNLSNFSVNTEGRTNIFGEQYEFDFGNTPSFDIENVFETSSRPSSRTSFLGTPSNTPRPPSVPLISPVSQNNSGNINQSQFAIVNPGILSPHNFYDASNHHSYNKSNSFDKDPKEKVEIANNSEKLRNLLTLNKNAVDEQEHKNRILKGLLNSEEDKEFGTSGQFKLSPIPRLTNSGRPKSADSKNPMLLSLLNEKSEDDDATKSKANEVLRQEDIRHLLKIQQTDCNINRKRPPNDNDENSSKKGDEKNRKYSLKENPMLAKLLSEKPKNPPPPKQVNIKVIPDIAPSANRSSEQCASQIQSTTSRIFQQTTETYLNQQPHVSESQNKIQILHHLSSATSPTSQHIRTTQPSSNYSIVDNCNNFVNATITTSCNMSELTSSDMVISSNSTDIQKNSTQEDPELAKILNEFIDLPEMENNVHNCEPDYKEEVDKINQIEKSLMMFESSDYKSVLTDNINSYTNTSHNSLSPLTKQPLGYQPAPPIYSATHGQAPTQRNLSNMSSQFLHMQQQQHKERLLQQQQKQHLVVPENATARSESLGINQGITNIGSLLNNSVAPNVALKRSQRSENQISPEFMNIMHQRNSQFQNTCGYNNQFLQNQQHSSFTEKGAGTSVSPSHQTYSQSQGNVPSPQSWTNSGINNRISLQHNNPMLSAQLQNNFPGSRMFSRRSITSPNAIQRSNSFQTNDSYTATMYQTQQIQRMQRQNSQSNQHLSGSTDYVRQELRAVVSNRTHHAHLSGNTTNTSLTQRNRQSPSNTCPSALLPAQIGTTPISTIDTNYNFDMGQNDYSVFGNTTR